MKSFIRNKAAEKEVSEWLSQNGYYGNSAAFIEMELHAIQRPGWLQIFRFAVRAKSIEGEWHELFGAMRADERYGKPTVRTYANSVVRDKQLAEWSRNLITHRGLKRNSGVSG